MKYLIMVILSLSCSAHNKCVDGKMYHCPENEASDCSLIYKTSIKINPIVCVGRSKNE